MANELSLLERFRHPAASDRRTARLDRAALIGSVVGNLRQMLNSRRGHAPAQLDLGIPAPCEIIASCPDSIARLKRIMIEVIEKYEPRLSDVQVYFVQHESETLMLHYLINGRLVTDPDHEMISFETSFDGAGLIHLDA
jgi:type VI secretion system protein